MGKESVGTSKPKAFVLDSWAVIAYLEDEPSAGKIGDIMAGAHEAATPLLMTVINVGEVWYTVAREDSTDAADESFKDIADLGIRVVDADWDLTLQAARFKVKGRISYADCYAAALAKNLAVPLVTGDPEFERLEKEISIIWV
jgi:ribonuclease VapC